MKDSLALHKALKYATDMKRLEEQGRVIILPCKMDKPLYIIDSKSTAIVCDENISIINFDECPYKIKPNDHKTSEKVLRGDEQ